MTRKEFALSLILSHALFAVSAHAADCTKATNQAAINACMDQSAKAADVQLNQLYGKIQGRLKDFPERRTHLVAAQRAWMTFRDAECNFASPASEVEVRCP